MTARSIRLGLLMLGLGLQPALLVHAARVVAVEQKGRAFSVREVVLGLGDTIRFRNTDDFLHQLYVKSADFNFASDEQEPGQAIDIRFTAAGQFDVRCEIHPKMRLAVTVH